MNINSKLSDSLLFPKLSRSVREVPRRSWALQVAIGIVAGIIAVGVRYLLPLSPQQVPTLPLVVTLAVVTLFVGATCGITTALVGGLLSWYIFFNPFSWSLANDAWVPLVGFAVIAAVIITTAHLYRVSERLHHEREIADLKAHAATADLFAREMAHRLKNSLAVVQAIAFQTIGAEGEPAKKFAGRLKALADTNDLLAEHVQMPTANAGDVVQTALRPFSDRSQRISVEFVDAAVTAQQAVSLALAVHELATNASKYGSLSTRDGKVVVKLSDLGSRLRLAWEERDGPNVQPPQKTGFGTRLLKRAGVETRLDFEPTGLICTIDLRKA